MLLSVVIPFYNVERYIGACLERAACLPQSECELLLVDDCGADGSRSIAQQFCAEHENARILRRECNGGLSAARNTGLAHARGEYVYFLDSDDLIEAGALMTLARRAKEQALDVAKARFRYLDDATGETREGPAIPQTGAMTGGELFERECREGLYEPMVWQCVYRRAFLEKIGLEMAEGLIFEDELFQTPALLGADRAAAYEEEILLYRQREGSIMASFARSSRWCACYLEVCRRLSALARKIPAGGARAALKKRVGQIALGAGKNIPAYGLEGAVKREATAFLHGNRRELSGFALASGDVSVAMQGLLMRLTPRGFMAIYALLAKRQQSA